MPLPAAVIAALLVVASAVGAGPAGAPPGAADCPVFPADNVWHADISRLPADPRSAQWIASMGGTSRRLHPDFGSSGDPSAPYGIPYVAVSPSHPTVRLRFQYADESDPGLYPFGPDIPIEGGTNSTGDRHAIMLDGSACRLYELYDARYAASGGSTAGAGAIWNLRSDALRPATRTSADAAGLPILPGLLRPDEVAVGPVDHAIRMTAAATDARFRWPARHQAGTANPALPPMGSRFRLSGAYDVSRFRPDARVVLRAMQTYGLILADNGSSWYFQGAASNDWADPMIEELKTVPAGEFQAVDESSLMVSPDSGAVRPAPPTTGATPVTAVVGSAPAGRHRPLGWPLALLTTGLLAGSGGAALWWRSRRVRGPAQI